MELGRAALSTVTHSDMEMSLRTNPAKYYSRGFTEGYRSRLSVATLSLGYSYVE